MSNFMDMHTTRTFEGKATEFQGVQDVVRDAMNGGGVPPYASPDPVQQSKPDVTQNSGTQGYTPPTYDPAPEVKDTMQSNRVGQFSKLMPGARVFADSGVDKDSAMPFAGEWAPDMETPVYIGTTQMLLSYLKEQERKHRVTMPIKACGIDPIVFENVERVDMGDGVEQAPSAPFAIGETDDDISLYEIIQVDGDLYMSCVDTCLDKDYLNSILAEATACMKARGFYTFEMVGFRKLALEEGHQTARLLNTLRLNTYEMSVLIAYLCSVKGVEVEYGTLNGKACIQFTMNNK